MSAVKVILGAAALAAALIGAGCLDGDNIGGNQNNGQDAQVDEDAQAPVDGSEVGDAGTSGDASTPTGGTISIYLAGDSTPKTFTDGLAGQTPTSYVIALSEYWAQTSLSDPSPAFCFDTGAAPVEADLSGDTLMGVCDTQALPTAVYTHGRVKVDWARYTVQGTLHYQGMPFAGAFTFFRAYSDTTYLGDAYLAGEGFIEYSGPTQVTIPTTYDPPLSFPGVVVETVGGACWMTFPYSQPLAVDQTNLDHHWARFHWEIYEGFRWQDRSDTGFADGVWDVGMTVPETEEVIFAGATGYYTTASTD
ncbi:MAG: hypothetical protein ABI333_27580 [bacterium]